MLKVILIAVPAVLVVAELTVGAAAYVYEVVAIPPGVVTVTVMVPFPAGAVILIVVGE